MAGKTPAPLAGGSPQGGAADYWAVISAGGNRRQGCRLTLEGGYRSMGAGALVEVTGATAVSSNPGF